MIVVKNKADCCGCTACYSVCPKKTISMQQDQEGFLYPFVEISKCIDCKLCDSACPIENKIDSKMFDRKAYVLRAKDVEIVSTSTSGGFVTPLGDCFSEIKKHLMQETKVCFIGTPCQVYSTNGMLLAVGTMIFGSYALKSGMKLVKSRFGKQVLAVIKESIPHDFIFFIRFLLLLFREQQISSEVNRFIDILRQMCFLCNDYISCWFTQGQNCN